MNQERLAALADYSRSTIANVETGRQHIGYEFWARCDEVLLTGDALRRGHAEVMAAERADRAQAVAQARYDSLAVAFNGRDEAAEPGMAARPELPAGPVCDPLVVAQLADALPGYARAAALFGGGDVLPLILRHVRLLHAGLDSVRGQQRERLVEACARYGEFAGWLCQDLGRSGDAMFWSDRALEWARESGDGGFVSYVLMRHSDIAEGRGLARQVLDLADAAGRLAALGPRARALVVQQAATGHALDGDAARFERTIEEARDRVEIAAGSDDAPWGMYCTPTYIAMQEASGWRRLGRADRAVELFEREIGQLEAADRVDGGVFRARLARAHAMDGEADSAGHAALTAWELACGTGSARAWQDLARVRRTLGRRPQDPLAARFAAVFDAHARPVRAAAGSA